MLFRKKIKPKPKRLPYGRRNANVETSIFDGMSFIEQLAMIVLPCCMVFMSNLFLLMMEFSIWWIRLIISIGITTLLLLFIYWIISWISERLL